MKGTVILVTSAFAPARSSGAFRPSKMAKYLARSGWRVVVLTRSADSGDSSTLSELEGLDISIHRTPRLDPTVGYRELRRMGRRLLSARAGAPGASLTSTPLPPTSPNPAQSTRWATRYFVPDTDIFWLPGTVLMGLVKIPRERTVIYSTSPNPSAHLVGLLLRRLIRAPWVVEFRDPWIGNPFASSRALPVLDRLDRALESQVLTQCDRIVATNARMHERLLARYQHLASKFDEPLPNGFDPEDFSEVKPIRQGNFSIVHTGTFYDSRRSDGFLTALDLLLRRRPELRAKVRVHLVGIVDRGGLAAISELQLGDVVQCHGQVDHKEALCWMSGADLLLLVPGPGEDTMPGKIYEYLAARKPMLALADPGVARQFIVENRLGFVACPTDAAQIERAIESAFEEMTGGKYRYPDTSSLLQRYDRSHIAERASTIFSGLLDRPSPIAVG